MVVSATLCILQEMTPRQCLNFTNEYQLPSNHQRMRSGNSTSQCNKQRYPVYGLTFLNRTENRNSSVDYAVRLIFPGVSRRGLSIRIATNVHFLKTLSNDVINSVFVTLRNIDRSTRSLRGLGSPSRNAVFDDVRLLNLESRRTAARFATRGRFKCHLRRLRDVLVVERADSECRLVARDSKLLRLLDRAEDERVSLP